MEQQPLKRFLKIANAVRYDYYLDLGKTNIVEDSSLKVLQIEVTPHEGIHTNIPYVITIKFQKEGEWPYVFVDSEIFDKIKTNNYLQNKGKTGEDHRGICIKKIGYAYSFKTNFTPVYISNAVFTPFLI
jgi:hypothetical protein